MPKGIQFNQIVLEYIRDIHRYTQEEVYNSRDYMAISERIDCHSINQDTISEITE